MRGAISLKVPSCTSNHFGCCGAYLDLTTGVQCSQLDEHHGRFEAMPSNTVVHSSATISSHLCRFVDFFETYAGSVSKNGGCRVRV